MRPTGIPIIGDVPWGTHFCQFYQDQQDLIDILVPYFKAGLENNEFCMWVTSEPLHSGEARAALAAEVKELDRHLRAGQLEILDYTDWYTVGGTFNPDRVLHGWIEKLETARKRGFEGLRLTGNTLWLEKADWKDFIEYEAKVDSVIGQYTMLAICTYSLGRCGALEIMDVVSNHSFALIKRAGHWQMIESAERKKIQASLRESEQRHQRLFETMLEGIVYQDAVGRVIEMNPAAEKILGRSRAEFLGQTSVSIQHETVRADGTPFPGLEHPAMVSLRTGREIRDVVMGVFNPREKDYRWIEINAVPLFQSGASLPNQVYTTFADVTDREHAEGELRKSEERYRSLFDNMTEGFAFHEIITDQDGRPCDYRFLDLNPSFERLTGLKRADVVGRTVREILPGIEPEWIQIYGKVALSGESVSFEKFYPAPLNRWYEIFSYRPAPRQFAVIFMDITARKQAEAERGRLLDSERAARSEAERANRIKDEFLANLSHELRTPLNPILGWVQILKRNRPDENTLRQGLGVIERNIRAQTQLISDLLDMSRIVSGKLRLDVETCELASVLETAIESITPGAEAKSIKIERVLDPAAGPVLGDRSRLQQVFWNLLSNAVKFTPSRGKIQIISRRVSSHVEVSVRDTGEGIEPDVLPYVFDRFRQADSSSAKRHGGLGLGLSIAKHLVELHGGSVAADSSGPGKGSTFTVSLPVLAIRGRFELQEEQTETGGSLIEYESVSLAGISVLIVDDESDSRSVVSRLLLERGAEVHTAASASQALEGIVAHRPDVLIADIGMPEADGYELIRRVRELPHEKGGDTPAVALTAYSRAEDRTQALLAGYQYHLAKPVEIPELIATLAMMTRKVRRARAARNSDNR